MSAPTLENSVALVAVAILALAAVGVLGWLFLVRPRLGLYTMLAIAPTQFIFIPVSDFFVSPADVLVLSGALGLVLRALDRRPRALEALRLHVFLGVMIAGYLIGFIVLDHFSRTLIRVPLAIVPSVLACELLRERVHFVRATTALVLAGVLDAAYGAYFVAIGQSLHPSRFSGLMGVNFSAIVIFAAAAISFARVSRTHTPVKFLVPAALTLAGLATLSKMGVLALGIAWVTVLSKVTSPWNRRLVAGTAAGLVALAMTQGIVRERVFARAQPEMQLDGVERTSTDVRVLILRSAWRGLAEQPLFGVGYFGFEAYSRLDPEIRDSTGGIGYGTHNTYLEILVEGGLLAFVPFVLHFLSYARRLKYAWHAVARRHDTLAAAALAGLIVVLVSASVANVLLHFVFWSVCGVGLAYMERLRMDADSAMPVVSDR